MPSTLMAASFGYHLMDITDELQSRVYDIGAGDHDLEKDYDLDAGI